MNDPGVIQTFLSASSERNRTSVEKKQYPLSPFRLGVAKSTHHNLLNSP